MLNGCACVIASTSPYVEDHPLITGICDAADRPETLIMVINHAREVNSVEDRIHTTIRSGVVIRVMEQDDYLGSAGAFLAGIDLAVALGVKVVILFDEDCRVYPDTCRELFTTCGPNAPIVTGNRNGRGDGRVHTGLLFAIKKAPKMGPGVYVTWAGMALALDSVPHWRSSLQTLAEILWFYWDDYVFSAWAHAQNIPLEEAPRAVFTSPNPPRRHRAGWRYYYEARNGVWFARLTMRPLRRQYFIALWFLEFVLGFGLRDRKFRWAWRGFWDGVRGVKGRTVQPIAKPEHYKLDMRGSAT